MDKKRKIYPIASYFWIKYIIYCQQSLCLLSFVVSLSSFAFSGIYHSITISTEE